MKDVVECLNFLRILRGNKASQDFGDDALDFAIKLLERESLVQNILELQAAYDRGEDAPMAILRAVQKLAEHKSSV